MGDIYAFSRCFYAKRLTKVRGSSGSNALVGCAPCPSGLTVVPQQGLRGAFAVWSRSLGAACASVADAAVITTVALSQRSASVHAALHTAKTQWHFELMNCDCSSSAYHLADTSHLLQALSELIEFINKQTIIPLQLEHQQTPTEPNPGRYSASPL